MIVECARLGQSSGKAAIYWSISTRERGRRFSL